MYANNCEHVCVLAHIEYSEDMGWPWSGWTPESGDVTFELSTLALQDIHIFLLWRVFTFMQFYNCCHSDVQKIWPSLEGSIYWISCTWHATLLKHACLTAVFDWGWLDLLGWAGHQINLKAFFGVSCDDGLIIFIILSFNKKFLCVCTSVCVVKI